jgi:HTH-type transcriptional regulator/antitoxin HigA
MGENHLMLETPDTTDAILHRMEALSLIPKDLEPIISCPARISEALSRKRPLTTKMIHKLNCEVRVPAEVLIRPYDLEERVSA